jgi:hypothetical protein
MNKCKFKNVECEHAGILISRGCEVLGERDMGLQEFTICYNNEIGRDTTKCNR